MPNLHRRCSRSRIGVVNTRPRDFYDIHVLLGAMGDSVDMSILRDALESTCEKRGSRVAIARWADILDNVSGDPTMLAQWTKYLR